MNSRLSLIPAGHRERFLPLLLLADESEQQVRSHMESGDLYAYSVVAGVIAGIVLAIELEPGVVELKAVAVEAEHQEQGIGKRMLVDVLTELRTRGYQRVIVGTANAAIGQLAYYQKAGFRLLRIERDFFSPARGYPEMMVDHGIRLRDMVWMEIVWS